MDGFKTEGSPPSKGGSSGGPPEKWNRILSAMGRIIERLKGNTRESKASLKVLELAPGEKESGVLGAEKPKAILCKVGFTDSAFRAVQKFFGLTSKSKTTKDADKIETVKTASVQPQKLKDVHSELMRIKLLVEEDGVFDGLEIKQNLTKLLLILKTHDSSYWSAPIEKTSDLESKWYLGQALHAFQDHANQRQGLLLMIESVDAHLTRLGFEREKEGPHAE